MYRILKSVVLDFGNFRQNPQLVYEIMMYQLLDRSTRNIIRNQWCSVSRSSATCLDVRKSWWGNIDIHQLCSRLNRYLVQEVTAKHIYRYFCLTWFSEYYPWLSVAFLSSNWWLTILYNTDGTTIHFRNFEISIFDNWNFNLWKLNLWNLKL